MKTIVWKPVLVFLTALLILAACLSNKDHNINNQPIKPVSREASGAIVSVDPRMELLAAHYILSGFQAVTMLECDYKDTMKSYFANMESHRSIRSFRQMHQRGLFWNAPPALMMHLTPLPGLEINTNIPDQTIRQLNTTQRQLRKLIAQMKEFASESQFSDFYDQNHDFYHGIVSQVGSMIEKYPYVDDLEKYFGQKQEGYHIILIPLIMGNYGVWTESEAGKEVFAMVSEFRYDDGLNESSLRNMVWHEFAHSFVDPLGYAYEQDLEQSEHLYELVEAKVRQSGYTNWTITVNEHIVRAVVIRLKQARFGSQMARERMVKDKEQGFDYLDIFLDQLVYYEQNRHLYPSFSDFYPRLIEALNAE